ncbi:MAG: hypothetical protein M3281_09480 [Chloroflexota bacterium]|nr:hypothetical protein [Chloroflexota bacterium]
MKNFRALIVHGSEEVASALSEELGKLNVPADRATNADEAVSLLGGNRYGAVLLDDGLPQAGSLRVFEALEGEHKPDILMVAVPRAALASARASSVDSVEFVATPESQPETERLGLRIRSRLINAGLLEEFGAAPSNGGYEPGEEGSRATAARNPWLAVIAVLFVLAALFLVLRILQDQGDNGEPKGHRPETAIVWMSPVAPARSYQW